MKHYDALIIGAGQAGVPLAKKLAKDGKKTAIIEKRWVGGTCINDGCTPTKTMIASARIAHQTRNSSAMGIEAGPISVNLKKIKKRKDEIVESFRASSKKRLQLTEGLDLIFGEASFSGKKELIISTPSGKKETVSGDWIFINTGGKPSLPTIQGLENIPYLTSTTILDLEEVPKHLVIIGANYNGLEFGQMFHRFGSKVTILEKASHIVEGEDQDVSNELTKILQDEGLEILCSVIIDSIEGKDGQINLRVTSGTETKCIMASHLLVATGRTPETKSLHLEIPGINTDEKGYILVNDRLETNVSGIYALGDIKGGPAFTHIAYHDFTIVYRNLIKKTDLTISGRPLPYCMYTDPQLARIGLSEAQAKKKGLEFIVAKIPMSEVARGIETGETLGFMKALVDPKSKKILGACILSAEGGEIMSVLQMAMEAGITASEIHYFIFAHPTYSEALNNLFAKFST